MEGLWLAQALRPLQERLPAKRLAWRFPDARTLVLPLVPEGALWIDLSPPDPRIEWRPEQERARDGSPSAAHGPTAFQSALAARAGGDLLAAEQQGLDRVVHLRFAADDGFVPRPPVELVLELTGRHANAVLVDEAGIILAVHREVGVERNRFRQVRSGLPYQPPPPYQKLDPRSATAEALAEALLGRPMSQAHRRVDGLGPSGALAWARMAGVEADVALGEQELAAVLGALPQLLQNPPGAEGRRDLGSERRATATAALRQRLRKALEDRLELSRLRLREAEHAATAETDADRLREEGNLLLALGAGMPKGADRWRVTGFDGEARELVLDPRLSAAANAERRFDRARRRLARAERARGQQVEAAAQADHIEQLLAGLAEASDLEMKELAERYLSAPEKGRARTAGPGLRVTGPHGFEVVIGRNARENDQVTFKLGRSMDVWLHAQGVHGAHVIVRSGGRELPHETLVFAAELAAGHAEVGEEDQVLVDHTLRKHVWKVKGMPPGAVHYTRQKTVLVRPKRLSELREAPT